jgi:hypothetical protein
MRPLFGVVLITLFVGAAWLTPWRTIIAAFPDDDDTIPWIPADGSRYPTKAFPELYKVLRPKGPPLDSFRVPDFEGDHDFLANAQFGSRVLYRCISTHRLEDHTPAGTLGWCVPHGSK